MRKKKPKLLATRRQHVRRNGARPERGVAVQCFIDGDLSDTSTPFVVRQSAGMSSQLRLSHGWVAGTLDAESLDDARRRYREEDQQTWPRVFIDDVCVDRHGAVMPSPELRVRPDDLRDACTVSQSRLSILLVRWGGAHRMGEGADPAAEGDGGWGALGCPPSDWYLDAFVAVGVLKHPLLGRAAEVLSLFIGSDAEMRAIRDEAGQIAGLLSGLRAASFWMLWPADFPTDWSSDEYVGYVERRDMFASQRALEATGRVASAFPHPADLWEWITSKRWMATLAPQCEASRLPACALLSRQAVLRNPAAAARTALQRLEELRLANRSTWASASLADANSGRLTRGVVKIGWSWEAKFVWFWRGEASLAECLRAMLELPGCRSEFCLVQEWVDFDWELRLFFLPPRDWAPGASPPLRPEHFEYTAWENAENADAPQTFIKATAQAALASFGGDELAMASAHRQATAASQPLIAELFKHGAPVPMIRMDWMVKRRGPGQAQVVFGEYCEMGACCLKWQEGPPKIWRSALDVVLY